MKRCLGLAFALTAIVAPVSAAALGDASHIDAYVTPYYNSSGPAVRVGAYSSGLASNNDSTFVATILKMKQRWNRLRFYELYVGAIRLYDLGYRNEAVYWFYSAQYRGRQFAMLVDQDRMGGMGAPGFELYHAQDAFFQLTGPYLNGYAFRDPDSLLRVVRRVQAENKSVGDLRAIYPGVPFIATSAWKQQNAELNARLDKLAAVLTNQKDAIRQQREQNGTEARFAHLTSKNLPGSR